MNRSRIFTLAPILPVHVRSLFAVGICATAALLFASNACSADKDTAPPPQAAETATSNAPPFEYQLENRPDPFTPFVTEKAATAKVNMDEIIDESGPLSGMQLFEPGQLTLVALLQKGGNDIAMVQDFTGKGYVLTKGMKIGRRGVVEDITNKSVIVEETAVTRAGKKIISQVVMLLKKEGEE